MSVPAVRRGRPPTHGLSGDPLYESIIKPVLRRGAVVPEWRGDPRAFYDAVLAEVGPRPSERHILVPISGGVFTPGNIKWYDRVLDQQAEAMASRRECECPKAELAACQCPYAVARRRHALLAVIYEDEPDLGSLGLALSSLIAEQHRPTAALQSLVDKERPRVEFPMCDSCDSALCALAEACERQTFG